MDDPVWIVGDAQGWLEPFSRALREVDLIDVDRHWAGGRATLAVAGDLVDNGPDGVGVIDLLMRLQSESEGRVHVLVGNHDVQLLAARRFGGEMLEEWLGKGGAQSDMERLSDAHTAWLSSLPAMARIANAVVQHADAMFYRGYGSSVHEVNLAFKRILDSDDLADWRHLLEQFGEHRAFVGSHGTERLDEFLSVFGADRLVHGHTPIARMLDIEPESVHAAYEYAGGRCVNVDPGIYLGGAGFAFRLS